MFPILLDFNECDDEVNGGCPLNNTCINTGGNFKCSCPALSAGPMIELVQAHKSMYFFYIICCELCD